MPTMARTDARQERGGAARSMSGMQRIPSRQHQSVPRSAGEAERGERETGSPLLILARRIREEQGVEGLRDFLAAMVPFSAPNELKSVASGFGMDYESIAARRGGADKASFGYNAQGGMSAGNMNAQGGMNAGNMNAQGGAGFDPNIMRMMQMMGSMGGAGNIGNAGNFGNIGSMGGMMGGMGSPGGPNGQGMGGMMQMMQLMRMLPMLQSLMRGGDMAQLFKMMGA